jgi:hypothetical protein
MVVGETSSRSWVGKCDSDTSVLSAHFLRKALHERTPGNRVRVDDDEGARSGFNARLSTANVTYCRVESASPLLVSGASNCVMTGESL